MVSLIAIAILAEKSLNLRADARSIAGDGKSVQPLGMRAMPLSTRDLRLYDLDFIRVHFRGTTELVVAASYLKLMFTASTPAWK